MVRRDAHYPAPLTLATDSLGPHYLNPIEDFIDEHLKRSIEETSRTGKRPTRSPLFNVQVNDGHFSALGASVWGVRVARRLELLLRERGVVKRR